METENIGINEIYHETINSWMNYCIRKNVSDERFSAGMEILHSRDREGKMFNIEYYFFNGFDGLLNSIETEK